MSLDRIDARFLLPRRPRTAIVIGDLPHWRDGLRQAGVRVVGPGEPAELAVATHARDAAAAGCPMALVEGGRTRGAAFFAVPRAAAPRLLVPMREPGVAHYALRRFEAPTEPRTSLRNGLAAAAIGRGLAPPQFLVGVGGEPGVPFVLRAALETRALPADPRWFLAAGQGDVLSRGVFVVFPRDAAQPTHVVKFARVTDYADPFERDERGFALLRRAGDVVAAHAPSLLSRFSADGIECSIETAAVGERLFAALQRRSPRTQLIDAIAEWLVDVETATRTRRVSADEVALPDGVPAVLQHNDPGTWNVVVDGDHFTLLDWEDAEEHGLPLADLWYFLADALAHVDGVVVDDRPDHFVRLFRGELPSSSLLFDWTRRAVERLGLPADAVGPLATISWMRHGAADRERRRAAAELPGSQLAPIDFGELARRWATHPDLGPGWDRWAQPRT